MNSPETRLQIALVKWWSMEFSSLGCPSERLLFHVPNGGWRDKRSAAIFKAMGVRAGIPDLILAYPRPGFHILGIELKAGSSESANQQLMRGLLIGECRWWVGVVHDLASGQELIREWFTNKSAYFAI